MITAGITAWRSTGSTVWMPLYLSHLARAYAELGQFDDAWRCIGEAMTAVETTKERWCEAEIHRMAGEIALKSPEPDAAKAEAYFERALAVARKQQAKSWELRAAMSMARLWRDQGKRQQARELLAPVYGWFTEGFDTRRSEGGQGACSTSWRREGARGRKGPARNVSSWWVFGRLHDDPIRTRRRQAYEKRQWTKSREAARLRCGGLYEGLIETPAPMVRDGTSRDEVDGAFKRVMASPI